MIRNKLNVFITSLFLTALFLLCGAAYLNAEYLVYPDDPYWIPDVSNNAGAEISPENPRNGNASLKLTTSGDLEDWAFYTRYSDEVPGSLSWRDMADPETSSWADMDNPIASSWGSLSEITALSFDWYRETGIDPLIDDFGLVHWDPFFVQTPVLRLLVGESNGDSINYSELVWELWYNDQTTMEIGKWIEEDLLSQNFWRHNFDDDTYSYLNDDDSIGYRPYDAIPDAKDISYWVGNYDLYVYGLSVGVGSYWPAEFLGYADNVYLAFGDIVILNDNFELPVPVPEPSTLLLLFSGLTALLIKRRKNLRN